MKKIILFFSFCVFTSFLHAQCLEWVKRMGGNMGCDPHAITYDASGYLYITGYIQDTMDFAPDDGGYILTTGAPISGQIYVAKFDVDGNLIWAKTTEGLTSGGVGYSIVTDADGSVYTTGYFVGAIDFDPGPGSHILGSTNPTNQIFIMKLDSSGNFRWAHSFAGNDGYNVAHQIRVMQNDKLLTVGVFSDTVDFDPGPGIVQLASKGSVDAVVLQLDTGGNFMWVKSMGGTSIQGISAVAIDPANNIIVKGMFKDSADLDPGPGTFDVYSANVTHGDIFYSKLDPSGNMIWVKTVFGTNDDYQQHIESDDAGNIYTVGFFSAAFDVDPGPGTHILTPTFNANDLYWTKMDGNGNLIWAGQTNATGPMDHSYIDDMVIDSHYSMYTSGFFKGQMDFDPGAGANMHYAGNPKETFITKIDSAGNLIWSYDIDSSHAGNISAMVVSPDNDLYLFGGYNGNMDVDPCVNEYFISAPMGYGGIFIAKFPQDMMGMEDETGTIYLTAYPNPTSQFVQLWSSTNFSDASIRISDIHGRIVQTIEHANGSEFSFDLTMMETGIYFIQAFSEGKTGIWKVIKGH